MKNLVASIKNVIDKNSLASKMNKGFNLNTSMNGQQWELPKKSTTWLYQLNYTNIYKSLIEYLTILRKNQNKKINSSPILSS